MPRLHLPRPPTTLTFPPTLLALIFIFKYNFFYKPKIPLYLAIRYLFLRFKGSFETAAVHETSHRHDNGLIEEEVVGTEYAASHGEHLI